MKNICLVVGPLCSGKTTYCESLVKEQGYRYIKVSDIVKELSNVSIRSELQKTGDLAEKIAFRLCEMIMASDQKVCIDGIRQCSIITRLISMFGLQSIQITWLEVPYDVRKSRFYARNAMKDEGGEFDALTMADDTLGLADVREFVNRFIIKQELCLTN